LKSTSYLGAAACAVATLVTLAASSTALAQTTTASTSALASEKSTVHHGDGVHLGVVGGVGFPRPLGVEGLIQIDRLVVFGAEYSALPTVDISGVNANLWAIAGDVSIFPLRNGFFVGVRAGRQHLGEQGSLTIAGAGTYSATQTADTTFVNPRIGFLWTWRPFALGIDAGVQIPVSTTTANTIPAGITLPSVVTDVTHTFSQQVLPTIDLLRVGVVM
jgi:hypothetical protein